MWRVCGFDAQMISSSSISFSSIENEETRREPLRLSNRHLRKFQVATLSERVTGNVFPIVCSGNNMIQHMCCVMPKNFLIVIFAATFCDFRRKMPPSQKRYVRNLTEALFQSSLLFSNLPNRSIDI